MVDRDYLALSRLVRRAVMPMSAEYRRLYRMSLRSWLRYHQRHVAFDHCTWMGVPALKNPLDAWIYQEIIHEVRPDVVVEIGSAAGGGTLYLAHLLDLLEHGVVMSVDFDRSRFTVSHDRIQTVTGRSDDPEVVDRVRRACDGKRVIVIHDADHSKAQVLADLALYAPLVTVGSYLIVEDGIVDLFRPNDGIGLWGEGPLAATTEFVRSHSEFRVDRERERYLLTYNPRGFLLRVR
jgi:cephalosporin hydroxylase